MSAALNEAKLLLAEFGPMKLSPVGVAYPHTSHTIFPVKEVPIKSVVVGFERAPTVPHFSRERAFSVLRALQQGTPLPPVNVYLKLAAGNDGQMNELYHGYHRYHLSLAIGFTHIPVAINSCEADNAL